MTPTNLLAARPEVGRGRDTMKARFIRALSARGILFGKVETALLPALYAATSAGAGGGCPFGPSGFQYLSGPPAEQKLYSRLRGADDAGRIWEVSEKLVNFRFPNASK